MTRIGRTAALAGLAALLTGAADPAPPPPADPTQGPEAALATAAPAGDPAAGAKADATTAAVNPSGWTPYSAQLLRSDSIDDRIEDLEWISGKLPVYLVPLQKGAQPYVRIEAELKRQGWAIFFEDKLIKATEDRSTRISIEVPLMGPSTQVEILGSQQIVHLKREVVIIEFNDWSEIMKRVQRLIVEGAPPPTFAAEAGFRSADGESGAAVRFSTLSAHWGRGWRWGLALEASLGGGSGAAGPRTLDADLGLRLPWGGGRWTLTLGPLLACGLGQTSYLSMGPQASFSYRVPLGARQTLAAGVRAALLVPQSQLTEATSRLGAGLAWFASHPELSGLFVRADLERTAFSGLPTPNSVQLTLGYQMI